MNRLQTIPRFAVPYGLADFMTALAAVFGGRVQVDQGSGIFRDRPAIWTGSGRQALWLILKALRLKAGSGIAIPLYSDCSVAYAVREAGYTPVFVDVDRRTLTMDPGALVRVRSWISAAVVVHFFGHAAPMDTLLRVADGIPVIEDTAHGPLSFVNGREAGTFGVACFYSFASTKYGPAGGGGLAVVNDPALADRVREEAKLLTPSARLAECWNPVLQAAKAALFRRPFYGLVGRPMRPWVERRSLLEPHLNPVSIQPGQAAVALRQALRLPGLVSRQRANSLRLLSRLSGAEDVVLPEEWPGARYNYYVFPVLVAGADERDAVRAAMLERHVDTSAIYFDIIERSRELGYSGGCPVAESVVPRMLTLPNYAALSDRDIDYVAETFLSALQACRAARRQRVPVGSVIEAR